MSALQKNIYKSDYDRIKTLYSVSKRLSTFASVEESFAEILNCASEFFPLQSAVLIEHWERRPQVAAWFASNTTEDIIARATQNAKNAYCYLSGTSVIRAPNIVKEIIPMKVTSRDHRPLPMTQERERYIILPLLVDHRPPLGALQLEGAGSLDENDLQFVNALVDLISITLDRYYKGKWDKESRQREVQESSEILYLSQDKIQNLEIERDLRETFVSLLSHDLRTPLTVILWSAEYILKVKAAPETCHSLASNIIKYVNRVNQMLNDLLDANRIRSGEPIPLNIELVDLGKLIQETLSELTIIHGDRFILKDQTSISIYCDQNSLRRVIENLCNNAIKYGYADTPVTLVIKQTINDVLISVHNKGDVISVKDQKSLFKQFHRAEKAQCSGKQGWGIGLTLVQGIAEAHGGSVSVQSNEELGTIFTVTLSRHIKNLISSTPLQA